MHLDNVSAMAVVLDGANVELARTVRMFGAGWSVGVDQLEALGMRYAVMVAPNLHRLRRGAPLVMLVADVSALKVATREACRLLDDVECAWVRGVTGEALEAVNAVVMADAKVGGSA
jgi:ribosomal protein S4E